MNDKEILDQIQLEINEGLSELEFHLREWLERHRITPRKVTLASKPEGAEFLEVWLITDGSGYKDSSYRLVYDESVGAFGLECTLNTGVEWYMGPYGSFRKAIEAM